MKRTQTLKANHLSKNSVIIADDTDTVLPNLDKNNKTIRINLKSTKNQISHSIKIRKKIKTYQTRIYSSGKPLPGNSNYSRNQSPYNSSYRGRSPEQRNSQNFSQNRYSRSNSQNNQNRNNYSRSNSNTTEFISASSSHSNIRNRHYSNNRSRNSSYNRNRNYSNNRNRSYFNHRNQNYKIQKTDQGTTHIIDQIIKDQMIIIITDHEIIHKTETRATTIDTETIPSHPIGIITVTQILNIDTEVT